MKKCSIEPSLTGRTQIYTQWFFGDLAIKVFFTTSAERKCLAELDACGLFTLKVA